VVTGGRKGRGARGAGRAQRLRRLGAAIASTLAVVGLLGAARPAAHPLHTTLTEVVFRGDSRTVDVTVRIFADDLGAAVARRAARAGAPSTTTATSEAAVFAYLSATFALTDERGRRLPLQWRGSRRQGDLLWISLSAPAMTLAGLRVRNSVLCELYDDQVNIVQASGGGRRTSLLFTKGDGAKKIGE